MAKATRTMMQFNHGEEKSCWCLFGYCSTYNDGYSLIFFESTCNILDKGLETCTRSVSNVDRMTF